MAEKTHEGWTNYETWAVNLWLTNEEPRQRYWHEQAADHVRRARMYPHETWTPEEDALFGLADELKETHEEESPLVDEEPDVYTDLLNAALSEVNWREIAESLLDGLEIPRGDVRPGDEDPAVSS